MESYSTSYSSSSNKSAYLSKNPEEAKGLKHHACPFQSHSLLHSVRKSQAKPWKKAPVAPMPATPIQVYKVDPLNFRDLVQQLTGAPEFKPQPHHDQLLQSVARTASATSLYDVASPPIQNLSRRDINATAPPPVCTNSYQDLKSEAFGVKSQENTTDGAMTPGLLDMNLSSPSSYSNWCSFPPMSPGTMASLEPGRVL